MGYSKKSFEEFQDRDLEQTQKEIEAIHEKITSIEFLEALKLIREKKKERNGNQLN